MEKENNTLLALIAVLLFSAVGFVLKSFLNKSLTNMTQTGILGDILNFIKSPGLFDGLLWLIVCIVIYFGTGYAFAHSQKTGPISLTFFLLWLFTIIGLIVGGIFWSLIEGNNVSLNLDLFIGLMAASMSFSICPALASALGISNKE